MRDTIISVLAMFIYFCQYTFPMFVLSEFIYTWRPVQALRFIFIIHEKISDIFFSVNTYFYFFSFLSTYSTLVYRQHTDTINERYSYLHVCVLFSYLLKYMFFSTMYYTI